MKDFIGGLTTFLTMSYIVIVNPSILSEAGIPFEGALTATVLLTFSMTLLMGLYARLPYAVAPGMGLNAFFTYGVVLQQGIHWTIGLGIVFWSGILFLIISFTGLREKIAQSIPEPLRVATAVGIGLFLTLIGFKNMGLVTSNPVTLLQLGDLDARLTVSLLGLALMLLGLAKRKAYAFLGGILFVTLVFWLMEWTSLPKEFFKTPDLSSALFRLNIWEALSIPLIPIIITITLTDLFDSLSTFVGVSRATKLLDEDGQPLRMKQGLQVDAMATMTAGLLGTSSGTAYIESAAGIEAGGRSGRAAVFTALCFLPCLFLSPLIASIPAYATAPVLVLVGALMFKNVVEFKFSNLEDVIPAFLTMILIPFTFSITQGIVWGFISYVVIRLILGKWRELNLTLIALATVCAFLLALLSH